MKGFRLKPNKKFFFKHVIKTIEPVLDEEGNETFELLDAEGKIVPEATYIEEKDADGNATNSTLKGEIKIIEGEYPIEVGFKFLTSEQIDYGELRQTMEGKSTFVIIDEEGNQKEMDSASYNAFLYSIRTALFFAEGFDKELDDGSVVPITLADRYGKGKIEPEDQITVFEAIKTQQKLFDDILSAKAGINSKN